MRLRILNLAIMAIITLELNGDMMKIMSPAFKEGGNIPQKYTCDGQNISPDLNWQNVPTGTQSLVLIVDDPDAQQVIGKTFIHWVVLNIDPEMKVLPEGIKLESAVSNLAKEFQNDFNQLKYGGPCPPTGEHRYYFTLFALDKRLELSPEMNPDFFRNSYDQSSQFCKTYKANILGHAQIMGKYKR